MGRKPSSKSTKSVTADRTCPTITKSSLRRSKRVDYSIARPYKKRNKPQIDVHGDAIHELLKPVSYVDSDRSNNNRSDDNVVSPTSTPTQTEYAESSGDDFMVLDSYLQSDESLTDSDEDIRKTSPMKEKDANDCRTTASSTEHEMKVRRELGKDVTYTKSEKKHDSNSAKEASKTTKAGNCDDSSKTHMKTTTVHEEMLTGIRERVLDFAKRHEGSIETLIECMDDMLNRWYENAIDANRAVKKEMVSLQGEPVSNHVQKIQFLMFRVLDSMHILFRSCTKKRGIYNALLNFWQKTVNEMMQRYRIYRGVNSRLDMDSSPEKTVDRLIRNMTDLTNHFETIYTRYERNESLSSCDFVVTHLTSFIVIPMLCHVNYETISYYMCNFYLYYKDHKKYRKELLKRSPSSSSSSTFNEY